MRLVAVVVAVLLPAVLALALHRRYLEWEAERVTDALARTLAWRAGEVLTVAERELRQLVASTEGRCTPTHVRLMLDVAYRTLVVREAGIFADGALLCTSWGMLAEPIAITPGKDRILPGEIVIIPSVYSALGLSSRSAAMNMAADETGTVGVNVLIPPQVFSAGLAIASARPAAVSAAVWIDAGPLDVLNLPGAAADRLPLVGDAVIFPPDRYIVRRASAVHGVRVVVAHARDGLDRAALGVVGPTLAVAGLAAAGAAALQRHAARSRFDPTAEFGLALADRELFYVHEPIVRLSDASPAGFELLLRWRHPARGVLAPAAFLEALESPRHAGALLLYAAEHLAGLDRTVVDAGVYHSINVPAAALDDLRWLDGFRARIAAGGVPPESVQLEFTERRALDLGAPTRRAAIGRLRDAGFRLALDDFGCGQNGLEVLAAFAFDQVKIDRAFIAVLRVEARAAIVVATMAKLARELAAEVVAEGIEREADVAVVRALGIELGQGYLFPADTAPLG